MKTKFIIFAGTVIIALMLTASPVLEAADSPAAAPSRPPQGAVRGLAYPLMTALDTDRDGELSAEEIDQASGALKKLDRNGDGKLDRMELRLAAGGPGVNRPGMGRGQDSSAPLSPSGTLFAQRIMRFDQDGDGKVTRDELPESMDRVLERADTNQDGAIDRAEAEAFARQFGGAARKAPPAREKPAAPPSEEGGKQE